MSKQTYVIEDSQLQQQFGYCDKITIYAEEDSYADEYCQELFG